MSTLITQIEDKSSTIAWSPHKAHADVIALGTKNSGGLGFEDYGGELDLYDLNIGGTAPEILTTVKTANRFGSLAWSTSGVIAGGMSDGSVLLWKFDDLIAGKVDAFAVIQSHKSEVKALAFCPLIPHKLASGSSDGQVSIIDTSTHPPSSQNLPASSPVEVTKIAWNTQVEHIVAVAHVDGLVEVWDLKQLKQWCQLRSPDSVSDIQWNPSEGLHLVTASLDDRNPIIKLWDLRASTSMPLASLRGHSQGILCLDWCPHDDTLMVSSGRDNRTILWDLCTLQPIADVPCHFEDFHKLTDHSFSESSASNIYGAASAQQTRYLVQWSPLKRGVIATCSLDRKVQAHSVNGLVTKCGRPPKWLRPNSGVTCGFGGTFLTFGAVDRHVILSTAIEQSSLVAASVATEAASSLVTTELCAQMIASSTNPVDKEIWSFMQVIFQPNARAELLEHLGFHADDIRRASTEYLEVSSSAVNDNTKMTPKTEEMVRKALVVGNFEAAVECCFNTGNLADALILASCGGTELWQTAQERYFASEGPKKRFLGIINAVVSNQLENLVVESTNWKETLATISTYATSDAFPGLCIQLGDKLEAAGDSREASLCYMCSLSLDKAVKFWQSQLDKKGPNDVIALHEFCRKTSVFMRANPSAIIEPEIAQLFDKYATVLAEQGLLVTAAKYVKSSPELKDQLYRSRESPRCLEAMGRPPDFPFAMTNVDKAPVARPNQQQNAGYNSIHQNSLGQPRQQEIGTGPQARSQMAQNASKQQKQVTNRAQPLPASQPCTSPNDQLPPGWIALFDPSSGREYYANQATGETSWEKPQATPVQSANTVLPVNGASISSTPSKIMSKYGDGFVTSSSHPELAEQYGNVGVSNPYGGASRPGTAAAVLGQPQLAKAPVSATFDPKAPPDVPSDHQHIKDCLLEFLEIIQGMQLTPADKKQLSEAEKGVAILLKRLARGDVSEEVSGKVSTLVEAIRAHDYIAATTVQTGLVSTDWREHKDWLKGIKNLIQLIIKKSQGR